jgi:subtilisin family serine protease
MKRHITSFLLCLFFVFIVIIFSFNIVFANEHYFDLSSKNYKKNEILVKYKDDNKIFRLSLLDGESIEKKIQEYSNNANIEYSEPNYVYRMSIVPSDTYFDNLWYLKKIDAPEAWDKYRESPNIVIAIIDSGIQLDHPDLRDNIWINSREIADNGIDDDKNGFIDDIFGWDFVNNVASPTPKFEVGYTQEGILHGTIIAGIAASSGNNATGISGITWRSQIMSLKVLNDQGEGDTKSVIRAIDYAIKNGADIINFSFVGSGYSKSLETAIRRAYDAGIIMVAAAGNDQGQGEGVSLDQNPMYPVCHDGTKEENMVIGVAATDALDQKASFSGYGFNCIDIAAPGVSIFSTSVYSPNNSLGENKFNKYYDGYWAGTSMAVPIVSATISLIETVNPQLDRDEIIRHLIQNTDNISLLNPDYLAQLGNGRININKSLIAAENSLLSKEKNLLIAPQQKMPPKVLIAKRNGDILFSFFAYDENFCGGVNVASGDIDGDGLDEIVTGAGFGGGPHIRIFSNTGELEGQFFAYDENFRGGVNVASGDIDGDGLDEIVTGAGFGGGPQVRMFNERGNIISQFFAYDENFRGGVNVATAMLEGGARGSKEKIVTSPGKGGGPHIKIFDNRTQLLSHFFSYKKTFNGGVKISTSDVNYDGIDDIITGAGPTGAPHVRIFDKNGIILNSFYTFQKDFDGGLNISSINY